LESRKQGIIDAGTGDAEAGQAPARRGIVVAALTAALVLAAAPLAIAEPVVPTLTVTASGEVSAVPDTALVTAGIVSEARTTAAALAGADKAAAALLAEATAAGIAKADVATADFSVAPVWSTRTGSGDGPARITGYSVSNTFTLRIRRLADLGPLLERVVAGGSNTVSGISFEVSDAGKRRDEARVAAVAAARARAELLAAAADQRLVRVLSISEGAAERPMPRVFAKAAMSAGAVPIEAGTQTISADVTMTFELAPRAAQ